MDRVLSYIVDLRCISSLFFMPLVPYPARFARHLPHAGKALFRKYRYPHPTSAPSGHLLPQEGGSIHASPFPWKGLPSAARRGWLPFCGEAASSLPSPLGKGDRAAVDRVFSQAAHLRRSFPLSFIPLVPYPARFARHLPHAGKALSVVILFLHVSRIRFDDARKAVSSYHSLPHWGRGTA